MKASSGTRVEGGVKEGERYRHSRYSMEIVLVEV